MKGDPRNPADWLKLALRDLTSARGCLRDQNLYLAVFCLEQAAEKALKGWLIGTGWSLVKTHDLERLMHDCAAYGVDLAWCLPSARRLKRLYLTDRYVDESPDPEPDVAETGRLLADVERLIQCLFPSSPPSL
jgi:HEPN domain-containing protein